jgi:hypothetical protein
MAMDQSGEQPVFDRKNYLVFLDKCLVQLGENTDGKSEVLEEGLSFNRYNRQAKHLIGIISLS